MIIWLAIFFQFILLIFLIMIIYKIFELFLNKEARQYPPYIPSTGKPQKIIIEKVSKLLEQEKKSLTILDPGCGTGSLLFKLAKNFPNHNFIGIEWSLAPYLICKAKSIKLKNVSILHTNMFEASFHSANIIICFLLPLLMKRVGEKILADCQDDVLIFSNSFSFPNLTLLKEIKTKRDAFSKNVYCYKK